MIADDTAKIADVVCPEFDITQYVLGTLCKHGHEWGVTGKSLRRLATIKYCVECNRQRSKDWKKDSEKSDLLQANRKRYRDKHYDSILQRKRDAWAKKETGKRS